MSPMLLFTMSFSSHMAIVDGILRFRLVVEDDHLTSLNGAIMLSVCISRMLSGLLYSMVVNSSSNLWLMLGPPVSRANSDGFSTTRSRLELRYTRASEMLYKVM